jgi:lecithin-cholesterol acyltransferase
MRRVLLAATLALAAVFTLPAPAFAARSRLTPIVLFPAFHLTRLQVTVHHQVTDRACPRSGTFIDSYLEPPSTTFSPVCQDELLTLRYDFGSHKPMPVRFHEQPGVTVRVADYGSTRSAPLYEPMFTALEAAGYTRDRNIRVAGYDARLTPDQGGFLDRSIRLIEQTYKASGNRPVRVVGHSNGPLYIQYLLTHVSQRWKDKYIQGFTPIAGNFPGQGVLYPVVFTGLNNQDFSFPSTPEKAKSASDMFITAPSTYMSASDPKVFGRQEVVVVDRSTGKSYTPVDSPRLFADAHLPVAAEIARYYIGFVKFTNPRFFPDVDVDAEKGSGIETVVGASLPDLRTARPVDDSVQFLTRDGDINQEDITNEAVGVWAAMPCYHFSLTDNPGVNHFELPGNANVLARLIAAAARPRSHCR